MWVTGVYIPNHDIYLYMYMKCISSSLFVYLAFKHFVLFECHWWVFCRRNARLAQISKIAILVSMMSLFTTTGTISLMVDLFISRRYHKPSSQHFCVDMNYHWYGPTKMYKLTVHKTLNFWNLKLFYLWYR